MNQSSTSARRLFDALDGVSLSFSKLVLLCSTSTSTHSTQHTPTHPQLQLTIYDDCHFSDYVAVVAQFNSERTRYGAAGGDLSALAWVAPARNRNRRSQPPPSRPDSAFLDASGSAVPDAPTATDALVAVAGASGQVSVVSVSQCRVVALLGDAGVTTSEEASTSSEATAAAAAAAAAPSTSAPTPSSRLPPVVALAGAPGVPGLLAALDSKGTVTLWDCLSGRPLTALDVGGDAISVALSPDGQMLATGHRGGAVRACPVPEELVARCGRQPGLEGGDEKDRENENDGATADGDKTPLPFSHPAARPQPALPAAAVCERVDSLTVDVAGEEMDREGNLLPPEFRRRRAPHSAPVESVRFLSASRLASKACDGSVVVFELGDGKQANSIPASVVCSFRAPGFGLGGGLGGGGASSSSSRCSLASTRDGSYLAVGTPTGDVHVFESATGKKAGKIGAAPRLKEAVVRGVGLSEDCRHLVVAAGVGGFVFRFEARAAAAPVEVAAAAGTAGAEEQPPAAAP